ncbi:Forkhead-associated (FHA) domain [Quillaja saponaria]|uniref:Forkhead-associated (FHA) domain n=1 Tax=Quillaja saponaria TaxID=32244 RepID=A0AAD7KQJ1_QUISA|nr:Forkhead-associated (FHA) domain [Quillaja saponaria]KAJ7944208.1 Forkhead-associated (FHA) domain [Quillaja saponaria]
MELIVDIASVPPWIPEDDLLLKNSIEAGASLEALAKGAVQFSRKFTVKELRDRWRSLLYDSDTSAEASARMVNLDLSATSVQSKSNRFGIKENMVECNAKRKVESLRRQYYTMRKRIRSQLLDSFAVGLEALDDEPFIGDTFVNEGNCQNGIKVYDEPPPRNCMVGGNDQHNFGFPETSMELGKSDIENSMEHKNADKVIGHTLGDNLADYGNFSSVEEVGPSHASTDTPLWKTFKDIPPPTMPLHESLGTKGQSTEAVLILPDSLERKKMSSYGYDVVPAEMILKDKQTGDVLNDSTAISEADIPHLGTNDDELPFMDVDGKDTLDRSCDDNVGGLLVSSPSGSQEDDVPYVSEIQKLDSETHDVTTLDVSSTVVFDGIADKSDSGQVNVSSISCPELDVQFSTGAQDSCCLELKDELLPCTLNTEDPEIPCNDNIGSPARVPPSVGPPIYKDAGDLTSSSTNERNNKPEIRLKKEQNASQASNVSQIVKPNFVPVVSLNQQVGAGMKPEFPSSNRISAVLRHGINVHASPCQSRFSHSTHKSATDGLLKEEEIAAPATVREALPKAKKHNDFLEPQENASIPDQEESVSDDDIPYFSDIETMILDMDLCPTDQDSYTSREVSRYQHVDTKRTIMRLEQCAQSFTQRAIASQGALAVLYGRYLKHYIKKAEVLVGRETDDIAVDIDLGREGRANKISRRQALIKMEKNGSFILKNLGKSSIFLNGKEVASGQLRSLSSSSLIEIREMAFIFEINNKSVRRFLENTMNISEQKHTNFTWLPEEGQ